MESDDDLMVVIVGDGENNEFPSPMSVSHIKQEAIDDDVEKIIETAEAHGEFVEFNNVNIKQERDEDSNSINENGEWLTDEEYIPQEDEDEDGIDDDDYNSGNEENVKQRHRMLKPSQQKSFVKELRDQYPELEEDTEALVTTLSEIMRNVKAPPPPQDYFIINGIMFECVVCGTISETIPAASRHYQEKHGERYLVCFACGVDFRSTTNLYKHEKRCMAADAVTVLKARARALGRKGRSRPYLPTHFPDSPPSKYKKGGERKFGCSMCPAMFVSKTYLQSHEMLHKGLRPYKCVECNAAYTSLAALSRHRKTHSDEQYVCDHCGRTFKIKAALVTHLNTHLPVKKFGCDQCEKRYATKAALLRHVDRKHLNLPPPCLCKICYRRFPRMSVLREHMKKIHGLLLMTRRMFFKSLPTLTKTRLEHAKVVLKSEVDEEAEAYPYPPPLSPPSPPSPVREKNPPLTKNPPFNIEEVTIKAEPIEIEDQDSEHQIVLSEEILQYMQSIQDGCKEGESYNFVVIDNSKIMNINYQDIANGMLPPNIQFVTENVDDSQAGD